jgi:hypothetical protein
MQHEGIGQVVFKKGEESVGDGHHIASRDSCDFFPASIWKMIPGVSAGTDSPEP